jgi:DNA-binding transcriptional LysR family regulator
MARARATDRTTEPKPPDRRRGGVLRAGSVDLNLLVYFDALFAEGQVSRAAERVGLSQPAMSLALKRLRDRFDDPLLIRTAHGMVPTARARELIAPVRKMLRQSRDLLEPRKTFNPAEAVGPYQLVATDYVASLVLPGLLKRLAQRAPRAQVIARSANPYQIKRWFEEGKVELGIGYAEHPSPDLRVRRLFDEGLVCIARKGHREVAGRITAEQMGALQQVEIQSMRKTAYAIALEQELTARGIDTKVGLLVSDFRIAPEVVAATDMIAVVPERVARRSADRLPLQVLKPPVPLPRIGFSMVWPERSHRDAEHRWLRATMIEVCEDL